MKPRELFALLLKLSGENANSVAKQIGVAQSTLQRLESGEAKQTRPATLKKIAEYFGVTPGVMLDEKLADDLARELEAGSRVIRTRAGTGKPQALRDQKGQILVWETEDELPEDDNRVWVDRWDYFCSAGDGVIQWEIRQKAALPFTKDFFKAIGSKPENCRLISVRGRSMEPYLFDKDMAMVDVSKITVQDGTVYALMFEDESLVKQVFKEPGGGLTLHSFNDREFKDKRIEPGMGDSLCIVGEIVYRSGAGLAAR